MRCSWFVLVIVTSSACGGTTSRADAGRAGETGGEAGRPSVEPEPTGPVEPNCAIDLDGNDARHCAVYQDGSVWCWGHPGFEVDSAAPSTAVPVRVDGVAGAVRVVVGPKHSCAQTDQGITCWGANEAFQIDESGVSPRGPTSPALSGGNPAPTASIGLGAQQTCISDALSHVYCRGADTNGEPSGATALAQLGSGRNMLFTGDLPLVIEGGVVYIVDDWREVHTLPFYGTDNVFVRAGWPSCAIKSDRSLWCGAFAIDDPGELSRTSQLPEGALWIGSGDFFVCVLTDSNKVWCEGWNSQGQLGRGYVSGSGELVGGDWVPGLEDVTTLSVNRFSACALGADGAVACWGSYGGNQATTPTPVSGCVGQRMPPAARPRFPG